MKSPSDESFRQGLLHPLLGTDFPELGQKYEGKVRDNYTRGDGVRIIIATDRVSAFDRALGILPLKGQMLNHVAAWWFARTESVVPNHLLDTPDPNVTTALECAPLPVEMVVRGYLTGTTSTSIAVHYARGVREFCGHRLPDGLRLHEKLPETVLTPSTKAAHGDHDVSLSRAEILAKTGMSARDFDAAAELAMALFRAGERVCAERHLILVDTKYEFGKTQDGKLVVIDEIHTPDSSRFWHADSYDTSMSAGTAPESLDKDYLRRYLSDRGFSGDGPIPEIPDAVRIEASRRYLQAVEWITGQDFEPNLEEPRARIRQNLARIGARATLPSS